MWWTKSIERVRKRKLAFWKRYSITRDYEDDIQYKRELNKDIKEIRRAKLNLEKKIAKKFKGDPKAFMLISEEIRRPRKLWAR